MKKLLFILLLCTGCFYIPTRGPKDGIQSLKITNGSKIDYFIDVEISSAYWRNRGSFQYYFDRGKSLYFNVPSEKYFDRLNISLFDTTADLNLLTSHTFIQRELDSLNWEIVIGDNSFNQAIQPYVFMSLNDKRNQWDILPLAYDTHEYDSLILNKLIKSESLHTNFEGVYLVRTFVDGGIAEMGAVAYGYVMENKPPKMIMITTIQRIGTWMFYENGKEKTVVFESGSIPDSINWDGLNESLVR